MANHDYVIQLAASFAGKHPQFGDAVADWLSWCLPRGVDPVRPAAAAVTTYREQTRHDLEPIHSWLDWSRPHRPRTPRIPAPPGLADYDRRPAGSRGPVPRRRPTTMLTADQTRRLLRRAEKHRGEPAAVALFLLATTDAIRIQQICRLNVSDVDASASRTAHLMLTIAAGRRLMLPLVVSEQVCAHLAAYPRAREFSVGEGHRRVPLLRNRAGGRTTHSALSHGIRRVAASADDDIRSVAHRITPSWLTVIDLLTWEPEYSYPRPT